MCCKKDESRILNFNQHIFISEKARPTAAFKKSIPDVEIENGQCSKCKRPKKMASRLKRKFIIILCHGCHGHVHKFINAFYPNENDDGVDGY